MTAKRFGWIVATGLALATAAPATAATLSGAYLAARQAGYQTDFKAAADYYEQALSLDTENPSLIEAAGAARLSLGEVERALGHARQLEEMGIRSQLAQMALTAGHAHEGRYGDILAMIDDSRGIGPLVDGLLAAWARLGQGDMSAALVAFDDVAEEKGLGSFAAYHKALALASVGDFERAAEIMSDDAAGGALLTRRGIVARVQVLSQLGRNDEAAALMDKSFNARLDPGLSALREALQAEAPVSFDIVSSPREGMAEVFYTIAGALEGEAGDDYTLLYTQIAEYLRPGHVDAILLTAQLMEDLGRHELAVATYDRVAEDHPAYHAAALGKTDALRASGDIGGAIATLEALAETHGDLPIVHVSLGDLYRGEADYDAAVEAYDRAVTLYGEPEQAQWFVFFARGIAHERRDDWAEAEADFRRALDLSPDQPQVLNYLGYSLVEKRQNLDEALAMIERAVEMRPGSGHIVDSLGWVLYRLGRYGEAVGHMERAAELMPVDPVVNDHLGDVYWAVGRKLEARFQWHRALSFVDPDDPDGEADPERIRRKLDVGLDAVLAEEGAPPLEVVEYGAD
ncbi:tetratricopeptide repeat protein [Marinovum sp.]|uniref:tetratricopeptide repeat protein n=1 Tax=Marinovum sp. TaxID=2024839 RepID=UPI002B2756FF|nr:tetratricopeptide repeat protein [Marinovum sp.]